MASVALNMKKKTTTTTTTTQSMLAYYLKNEQLCRKKLVGMTGQSKG